MFWFLSVKFLKSNKMRLRYLSFVSYFIYWIIKNMYYHIAKINKNMMFCHVVLIFCVQDLVSYCPLLSDTFNELILLFIRKETGSSVVPFPRHMTPAPWTWLTYIWPCSEVPARPCLCLFVVLSKRPKIGFK